MTTVFKGSVSALAKAHRYPDFPLAVVKHPVAYITDQDLDERASDAAQQIVKALLTQR